MAIAGVVRLSRGNQPGGMLLLIAALAFAVAAILGRRR